MKKKLAFVLGGGGSRGSLQVGALRALIEAGYQPDLVTGTSIGAANGAFLAVQGFTDQGVKKLEQVWKRTIDQDLLPTNLWWPMMRAFFRREESLPEQRIRDFAIENGLSADLQFKDIKNLDLYLIAADLNIGSQVIFGENRCEYVLEGVLASMTLPPWMPPREKDGRLLVDGGAVSTLPIEAALRHGATEIIALDLFNPLDMEREEGFLRPFFMKLDKTVEKRQIELETELAQAYSVPVRRIRLADGVTTPFWDFRHGLELIEQGYHLTSQAMESWLAAERQSRRLRTRLKDTAGWLRNPFKSKNKADQREEKDA